MSVDIFGYCDPSVTHVSIPETLIPEGNKSRVSGDGLYWIRGQQHGPLGRPIPRPVMAEMGGGEIG